MHAMVQRVSVVIWILQATNNDVLLLAVEIVRQISSINVEEVQGWQL